MKTEPTPGPWKITYSPDGKEALINRGHVASVELDDNENGEANAKLIAAAPDMLEALEKLVEYTTNNEWRRYSEPNSIEAIRKAIEAINKAKGKSQ